MDAAAGRFCWVDLAAADARQAADFYAALFGWRARDQEVAGGRFTRLRLRDADVGSLYQLSRAQMDRGVPSHWTPYVRVDDVDEAVRKARALQGRSIVERFEVPGLARVALIADPGDALLGLWQDGNGGG